MHGEGVNKEMLDLDLGIALSDFVDHSAPQATRGQDIGLVHRSELPRAFGRPPKRHVGDPFHFFNGIQEGVKSVGPLALLLSGSEIDAPG